MNVLSAAVAASRTARKSFGTSAEEGLGGEEARRRLEEVGSSIGFFLLSHRAGAERRSVSRVMSSSCSQPSPTKE